MKELKIKNLIRIFVLLNNLQKNGNAPLGQEIKKSILLLDNREPRNFARTVNLKMIGTVGVIRFAWTKGLIKEPIHEINKLRLNGFWIGEKLIEQFKKDVESNMSS